MDLLMRLLRGSVRATHILDDDELASDATGLGDERGASVSRQVVEEMAGEDPVELAVAERQRCDIPLEHTGRAACGPQQSRPSERSGRAPPARRADAG